MPTYYLSMPRYGSRARAYRGRRCAYGSKGVDFGLLKANIGVFSEFLLLALGRYYDFFILFL